MNNPVIGLRVASVIFGLAGFAHLVRLLAELEIVIGSRPVPMWISGVAVVVAGALCVWLWRLTRPAKVPAAPAEPSGPGQPTVAAH